MREEAFFLLGILVGIFMSIMTGFVSYSIGFSSGKDFGRLAEQALSSCETDQECETAYNLANN